MVLAQKMYNEVKAQRDKRREAEKKAREEGREEGRASQAAASAEWLARMQEAQQRGEPFDEAPPGRPTAPARTERAHSREAKAEPRHPPGLCFAQRDESVNDQEREHD